MKTAIYHRDECLKAKGLCVVIDVLRAFTTAAFAFAGGAREIILVSSAEEAFKKREKDESLLLMGESGGKLIKGFHYGNSPLELQREQITNRRMVQRTSSGTQGVVLCRHADHMLIASFVVAKATLKRIQELNPSQVCFIVTGKVNGDEDLALAEYLQGCLLGQNFIADDFLSRVRSSPAAQRMTLADPLEYEFGKEDLQLATQLDRFSFAMQVFKDKEDLIARPIF